MTMQFIMKDMGNVLLEVVNVRNSKNKISEYLKMDLESLYKLLGKTIANDYSTSDGKKILQKIDQKLYQIICNEMEYCKNKSQFTYLETQSLAELLVKNLDNIEHMEKYIPKELLAVLLVKIGLSRFCKC
ncbi:MAG: hypothetical protein R3327_01010 [Nitrosopumilaceae archaeon]|nr:hypothetical protein [Nitrosopumilaceae archaeon]